LAAKMPSSKLEQRQPKTKRARFELQFTCNVCNGPNSHSISWHAYNKGTVLATCPGCQSSHLIADHLNWIEDDFQNLEQYMAERGTPVDRVVDDGVAAAAAAESASFHAAGDEDANSDDNTEALGEPEVQVADPRRPWRGSKPELKPVEGITEEQARRIREAVRKQKRRSRNANGGDTGAGPGGV
jgi:protein import protein ZIM17